MADPARPLTEVEREARFFNFFNRGRGDRGAGCWGERVAFFPNPGNLAVLLRC